MVGSLSMPEGQQAIIVHVSMASYAPHQNLIAIDKPLIFNLSKVFPVQFDTSKICNMWWWAFSVVKRRVIGIKKWQSSKTWIGEAFLNCRVLPSSIRWSYIAETGRGEGVRVASKWVLCFIPRRYIPHLSLAVCFEHISVVVKDCCVMSF